MKNSKKLTAREELFCQYFAASRDPRSAAARAGYSTAPERSAARLLGSPAVAKRLSELEARRRANLAEVTEGYRRLAFGPVADAVALLCRDELPDAAQLDRLDLFLVSDIKRPKGGGLEIKFFDRLKALDRLCEISSQEQNSGASDFFKALETSARALSSQGEDDG